MIYGPTYGEKYFRFFRRIVGSQRNMSRTRTRAWSRSPTRTYCRVLPKRKTDLIVGWAVEHFPYHLTLLKLAVHRFRV